MSMLAIFPGFAQVSLGSGDQTDVTVKVNGVDETFTVLRDYKRPDQFYYVPGTVRLATRGEGKNKRPVFHLLKYQVLDKEINELVEGGIMQFSVRFSPGDNAVGKIKTAVADEFGYEEGKIKLSALPYKSAEVSIYDLEGELLATEFQKPGVGPAFANNEIPFQVQLTSLSADVYDALTRGGGGIPVYITYTFDQVSPATGFKVTVDWNQTYKHFSKDEKTRKAFTQWYYYRTWWGRRRVRARSGVQKKDVQTLSEILQENKNINVESLDGENISQEDIDRYIDPIIERINKELVEKMAPPEKIDPAATSEPNNPGYWRTSSNIAIKNVNKVKQGKEVIEFNRRHLFESKDTYGSIVGIGNYDEEIQKKLITIMPAGNWNSAYFPVPAVGDSESLDIKEITLQVVPKYYNKNNKLRPIPNTEAKLATWRPDNGYFCDISGNEITNLLFPMQAITDELSSHNIPLKNCTYEVTLNISQGGDNLKFVSYEEFLMGGIPISTPMARIEGVEVDCDIGLTWGNSSDKTSLAAVQIKIESEYPKKSYSKVIKVKDDNKIGVFLVEKEDEGKKNEVKAVINFILFNGKKIPWKHNGRNLRDDDLGLSIMLWDTDYME
jgi:hypothetical protein